NPLKKGLMPAVADLISVEHANLQLDGSKKMFIRDKDDKLNLSHHNFLYNTVRNFVRVLVFSSFYSKKTNWDFMKNGELITKIFEILRNEISRGNTISDLVLNIVMLLTNGIQRSRKEIKKIFVKHLFENGVESVLRNLFIGTANPKFTPLFVAKTALFLNSTKNKLQFSTKIEQ
ncbi:hypothetical protein MHBO_001732, partial [Bonamia ostreae]